LDLKEFLVKALNYKFLEEILTINMMIGFFEDMMEFQLVSGQHYAI
jgi:hypothetical protein